MLRIQFRIRPCTCFGPLSDPSNSNKPFYISSNPSPSTSRSRLKPTFKINNSHAHKSSLLSCKSSNSNSSGLSWSRDDDDDDEEFLEAFVLASETVKHYQLRRQGFVEGTKRRSSGQFLPFPLQAKEPKSSINSIGHGFLRRFRSPTIFLKIACDGDVLLPIIVGEFAIEMLIDAFRGNGNGESPDQFEFVRNLVGTLGYEVKMVRITERVINTYYACIYLGKPGDRAIVSVDARPSDAINVAIRCKAPIYISKQIVSTDAIKIVYGKWKGNYVKSIFDVSLDSALEGPDSLAEELDLLAKMNIAVQEERYNDAAIWRDKLIELRKPKHDL
eukprot:TRINITY_DN4873_c2_g1_i2.p1 TRINITY_DN4873_c2_g1~~TRINITY_DN4873_c2_g1_i2.p1  ORF type:complete len:356 (-),score=38.21 TRINITY_DN4873_c2_g1_i2:623-1615(-)